VNDWAEQTISAAREQGREPKPTRIRIRLASGDLLAQAERLIMDRFNVDSVRAPGLLFELAQNTSIPVRVVAEQVVNRKIRGSRQRYPALMAGRAGGPINHVPSREKARR
jgi:hypothetical protein